MNHTWYLLFFLHWHYDDDNDNNQEDDDDDDDGYLLTECAADNDYPVCTASVYNRGSHVSHQIPVMIMIMMLITMMKMIMM